MKRLLGLMAFAALAASGLHAQAINTTVCDVLKNPAQFDGKMVTIKGTVVVGFDQFVLNDNESCAAEVNGIWLDYPAGSKAKAGPIAVVELSPAKNFAGSTAAVNRAPVTLNKDKVFKQFDSALSSWKTISSGLCLGCAKYTVQATITGRLDGTKTIAKRENGKITVLGGFGNVNQYPARLVIASVADVTTKDVDYSKLDALVKEMDKAKGDQPQGPPAQPPSSGSLSYPDAKAQADKLVASMQPGGITDQLLKDLAILPKPKEQSSIVIATGVANEVAASDGAAGAMDSPDGVIYTCTLNRERLPDLGMPVAVVHVAQLVNDARAPMPGNEDAPLAIRENNAWAVSTTLAIYGGNKLVAADRGVILWNSGWAEADRIGNMQGAQSDIIQKEMQLNR